MLPKPLGEPWETRLLWRLKRINNRKGARAFETALAQLNANSVCLDLGANVGDITKILLDSGARVIAFEPDPWAFNELCKRFVGEKRLVVHNLAVGTSNHRDFLTRDPGFGANKYQTSQGSTIGHRSLLWCEGEPSKIPMDVVDLRQVLRELPVSVDLVKMDIEGSEVEILENLLDSEELGRIRELFVETHEAQMPELRKRTKLLRRKVKKLRDSRIHLDWN